MNENRLTTADIIDLLQMLRAEGATVAFNEEKQALTYKKTTGEHGEIVLPLTFPRVSQGTIEDLLLQIQQLPLFYTIILVQAGAAAIGCYEHDVLVKHRVIKKYMIRKSQGTAQIKYLKSKGKSRLGSRIRLHNSVLFFREINETLTEFAVAAASEKILLSLPINLIHPLFTADIPVPFEKKDPRIKKIPIDVHVPGIKELGHIHWLVSRGILTMNTGDTL